ncbi:hypothetical protein PLESTB_001596900 [Pleodorina starrii]|uniref:PDZ domain-containing protein n=1 Tax=Pleodorina starrii TaxID=330485 RepID=A0A9W6BXX7_9CHLO|nr:hypothetical protein PLESTM_000574300 [Pleodorina starrii]GLC60309.1 hypothetical protein PLESTB_001596900 [Pleodorina starrii]GLC66075.1 hypothetical protein PLESTF_000379000 [Pleodorina starrii]
MQVLSQRHVAKVHLAARAGVTRVPRCVQVSGASNNGQSIDQVPIGCSRYSVALRKPLGIVLEQDSKSGNIFVVEIKPDGSAARDGRVKLGDQLIATSGVIYTTESDYGGATVKGGQQVVRLRVQGETFKTVSAAIGSHPGHMAVTLEFQRCDTYIRSSVDGELAERPSTGK